MPPAYASPRSRPAGFTISALRVIPLFNTVLPGVTDAENPFLSKRAATPLLRPTMHPTAAFAVLFDWDGVILDSSAAHEESWERLAKENGLALPPGHFKRGFGRKNESIISDLLDWTTDPGRMLELSLRKEELYRDVVRERGQTPLPGVVPFLDRLDAGAIPRAIASSTHRANIELNLSLLGLQTRFSAIVSAEDVTAGKPDPQVFLKAAEKLGFPPHRCLVFEDAPVGLEAAAAAGMRAVAVATSHPASSLTDAVRVVARLDELDWETLASWFPAD